jgi:hypothetical protein
VFTIEVLLSAIHVSGRDYAYQLPPDREGHKQAPALACLSKSVVPLFPLRMAKVAANDQGLIEEDVFGFFLCDLMSFPILLTVPFVPVEAGALIERVQAFRHDLSIR